MMKITDFHAAIGILLLGRHFWVALYAPEEVSPFRLILAVLFILGSIVSEE